VKAKSKNCGFRLTISALTGYFQVSRAFVRKTVEELISDDCTIYPLVLRNEKDVQVGPGLSVTMILYHKKELISRQLRPTYLSQNQKCCPLLHDFSILFRWICDQGIIL
jgi:hypothetical protein